MLYDSKILKIGNSFEPLDLIVASSLSQSSQLHIMDSL